MERRRNPKAVAKYICKLLPSVILGVTVLWVWGFLGTEKVYLSNIQYDIADTYKAVAHIERLSQKRLEYLQYRLYIIELALKESDPTTIKTLSKAVNINKYIELGW
jgi:hypothetical protein